MNKPEPFIDIHCHLLPALDDGPAAWEESLEMAKMAAADGIVAIVATPHQLGNYPHITAENIRIQVARLQSMLEQRGIDLELLPGADVRIDPDLTGKILSGEVLTLADRRTACAFGIAPRTLHSAGSSAGRFALGRIDGNFIAPGTQPRHYQSTQNTYPIWSTKDACCKSPPEVLPACSDRKSKTLPNLW